MEKNQIKVKNLKTGQKAIFLIKNGRVYNRTGRKPVYCGCTGKTEATATPMQYNKTEGVYCPKCHEKKVEILQTYDEWKLERDEKERKMNEEKLANLHLVEMGSDWECGFKYYGLSANIDYNDWLKVKEHFRYYRRGWSRGQELEWNYGEPTGWLTMNPLEVEDILVGLGLIKSENTMKAIELRAKEEKERKEQERKIRLEKRLALKESIASIEDTIKDAFDSEDVRELSDADANHFYFNATYGRNTVLTYTVTDNEIIKVMHMGDFKYGLAIPYSSDIEELIKQSYSLELELAKC